MWYVAEVTEACKKCVCVCVCGGGGGGGGGGGTVQRQEALINLHRAWENVSPSLFS